MPATCLIGWVRYNDIKIIIFKISIFQQRITLKLAPITNIIQVGISPRDLNIFFKNIQSKQLDAGIF